MTIAPDDRSIRELGRVFLRLGLTAFGGPAAHIALFRDEVVRRRGWLTDQQYLDLLGAANLLFGSGYLLLAFLQEAFVDTGLLSNQVLLDAVAVGQVTPGPLFTTATFIGYQMGGLAGAVAATVGIFLPSFVLVAIVHPFLPRMRASRRLAALLDGVNAAALGLIAAVAVELGRAAFVDAWSLVIVVVAAVILFTRRAGPTVLLFAGGIVGLLLGVVLTGR